MGIQVEFNPDLALKAFKTPNRKPEECIPEKLETGKIYNFLKKGLRNYWLKGEIPLRETKGNEQLSKPIASIKIIEAVHFIEDEEIYTKGKYKVTEVFNQDNNIKFECFDKIQNKPKKVGAGVGILVLNKEGKILLGKRHQDPNKADSELRGEGTWTMPGGKLDFGESFEECAKRETKEETGIELNNIKVICINNDKNEHAHFVTIGLFSDDYKGEPKIMEPDEITEWKWFDLNQLPKNIYFPSAKVLENYKQNKFYIQ